MRLPPLILFVVISTTLFSCVGKKKHQELIQALTTKYESKVDTLQSTLDTAHQDIRALELNLAERKGENNALTAMQDKLQGKIDNLEEALENLGVKANTEQNTLDSQLKETETILTNKLEQVKAIQQRIADSEAILTTTSSELLAVMESYEVEDYAVEIQSGKIVVVLTEDMLFRSGSTSRMDPDGVEAIEQLSGVLNKYPLFGIQVVGHTDNQPVPRKGLDRWNFSALRAATITKMMVEDFEVNPNQIIAAGKGDYAPRASNETKEGRAKNKRVELVVFPRQDLLLRDIEKDLVKILAE